MITPKGQYLSFEKIDTSIKRKTILQLCEKEIPGAAAYHITLPGGERFILEKDDLHYNIFILIDGSCRVCFDDVAETLGVRTVFIPSPQEPTAITAVSDVHLVHIVWDIVPGDEKLLDEYQTGFPMIVPYEEGIQYVDPNKSAKTISRMLIPHKRIPRFTMGSVESYGSDLVRPHAHPMLDQFFFSFPENKVNLIINGEKIPMGGNEIVHIPLGSDHGVEVTGTDHMHYMWIDFLPDNEAGLKRLDFSHRPTGTVRSFDNEDKYR